MFFNSLTYFIFLPVVFLIFSFSPDRWRWLILLLASFVFYGSLLKPYLLVVLSVVILISFWFGKLIDQSQNLHSRKRMLWIGVAANLSFLLYFKYAAFLLQNLNVLLGSIAGKVSLDVPPLLVSIGISFFIFQAISYLADIYFRTAKPEPHLGYLALYLSFFPKLLQGPIERSKDLLPQLKQPYKFDRDFFRSGLLIFTWGLFKKVVVADRLALYVDAVYGNVGSYTGLTLILATYLFTLQIYFDFSGYTDMALGTARFFNIRLTQNFNSPYLATSVADFWRRWHISFSRWIFEYVFEPLQMRFRNYGNWGIAAALLVTFILAGLWHGASWTFILFGLTHGIYLSVAFVYKPYRKKLYKLLGVEKSKWLKWWQVFVTFNLVSFSYVFFRADNLNDAWLVINKLTKFDSIQGMKLVGKFDVYELYVSALSLVIIAITLIVNNNTDRFKGNKKLLECITIVLVYLILLFTVDSSEKFIYNNF